MGKKKKGTSKGTQPEETTNQQGTNKSKKQKQKGSKSGAKSQEARESYKKTPYQGKKCAFGEFRCDECEKVWQSGYTWANCGQQCRDCHTMVYPHRQWPIKGGKKRKDNRKPHLTNLCEKCKKLGHNCVGLRK